MGFPPAPPVVTPETLRYRFTTGADVTPQTFDNTELLTSDIVITNISGEFKVGNGPGGGPFSFQFNFSGGGSIAVDVADGTDGVSAPITLAVPAGETMQMQATAQNGATGPFTGGFDYHNA